ncbi:MAG: hypothetical protein QMB61_04805 [Clostridiaceae bacterium]
MKGIIIALGLWRIFLEYQGVFYADFFEMPGKIIFYPGLSKEKTMVKMQEIKTKIAFLSLFPLT